MATTITESLSRDCTSSHSVLKTPSSTVKEITDPARSQSTESTLTPIRYTYRCANEDGRDFEESHDSPLDVRVTQDPETPPPAPAEDRACVVEIVTNVTVAAPKNDAGYSDYNVELSLETMRVRDKKERLMIIHSQLLLQAIREVVKYYPSQNLVGDTVTIREPYAVLIHHASDLQQLHDQLTQSPGTERANAAEKCRHIRILLDLLARKIDRSITPAQKRLEKATPTVIFKDLWYLLRPGLLSYFNHDGEWLGGVIQSVSFRDADDDEPAAWEVTVWFQDNSGSRQVNEYAPNTITIEDFDGERLATSLPVIPRDFYDRTDNGERKAAFIRRGERARDILWDRYIYAKYDGKLMDSAKSEYKGPIVAGVCDIPSVSLPKHNWTFPWDPATVESRKAEPIAVTPGVVTPIYMDPGKYPRTVLTEDHLFIMCPVLLGFALSTKSWEVINVDSILELDDPDKIPPANIELSKLKVITALSDRQVKTKVPWSADFIKNKGEGVVVLLHGPPGVGKTYTVETIANNTRRPLISLTIADLGTEEDAIESRLTQWFALAQKWRAILLLDEADIFLERREHKDISRNGIVSVFLRKMEYFNGLLFLTTNRVGHIDEAFISRAHVIIAFEKLDVERRRMIWKSFLSKLHAERKGQIRVGPSAEKFLLQSDEMGNMDWNGREIRNAFQTAIALAEYDARSSEYFTEGDEIIVDADHFRTVMEMSHSFRAYMDSIRRDTEEQRARQFYGRNDFFSAQALAAGHREGNAENSRLEVPRPSTPALPQFRRAASPRPGGLR